MELKTSAAMAAPNRIHQGRLEKRSARSCRRPAPHFGREAGEGPASPVRPTDDIPGETGLTLSFVSQKQPQNSRVVMTENIPTANSQPWGALRSPFPKYRTRGSIHHKASRLPAKAKI